MTSNQELKGQGAALSPLDLKQIRDAVCELRASSPKSALADLVEEKIRALEDHREPSLNHSRSQESRLFS